MVVTVWIRTYDVMIIILNGMSQVGKVSVSALGSRIDSKVMAKWLVNAASHDLTCLIQHQETELSTVSVNNKQCNGFDVIFTMFKI